MEKLKKLIQENKFQVIVGGVTTLVCILLIQSVSLFSMRRAFDNDSILKSRQIQRLDAGINFDSKRQQFVIKVRDIIMREAKDITLQEAYDIAEHDFYIAEKYMIDPVLLLAMQRQESRFNIKAVSSENAMGLNQLIRTTGHIMAGLRGIPYCDSILFDFRINNELSATYISYLKADFDNNIEKILIAYNAGPRWVGYKNLPEETKTYVPSVKKYYDTFEKELSFCLPGTVSKK